jgi:dihydrofolate synthase/folylpolyglutamate synthase
LIARVVIRRRCAEQSAFLVEIENAYFLEDVTANDGCFSFTAIDYETKVRVPIALQLPGRFQVRNALTALAAARMLAERGAPIDDAAITRGFAEAVWPGRLERIGRRPDVYVDGTHNPAGAREISVFWEQFLAAKNIYMIYGAMRDKAVDEIAGLLFPRAACVILTTPAQSRSISAPLLAEMTAHYARRAEVVSDPKQALARALELAAPEDVIFITGSLYLVGELRHECISKQGQNSSSITPPEDQRVR